jgi:acyl-CoA thioester hydrolase
MANAQGVHVFPLRVYCEDTDASGIVYYANYLRFAERARTEMLRDMGVNQSGLMAEKGVAFAVRHCTVDYMKPGRLDDSLEVHTRIVEVSGSSLTAEHSVRRDGTDLVAMNLRLVCMKPDGRPTRLPADVRTGFLECCNTKQRIE